MKKVLIIEDEKALSNALKTTFEGAGFEVLQEFNGKYGLEAALKKKPDIILLDIVMPQMDGITVVKELRKDEWGSGVPVILLTNLFEVELVNESLNQSVTEYLIKADWTMEDIVKKVKFRLGML